MTAIAVARQCIVAVCALDLNITAAMECVQNAGQAHVQLCLQRARVPWLPVMAPEGGPAPLGRLEGA